MAWGDSVRFPQHPHEHRPKRPVLLAVDRELGRQPYSQLSCHPPMACQHAYSRLMWFSWIEDPTTTRRPPPREPNWREVILVLAAVAIVLTLALSVGAIIR